MKSNKGFWITAGAAILAAVILAAVLLAGRREASAQGNEQGGTLADALNGGSARDKYMTEEAADEELRGLAETILESQEEEIRRMESLLSDKNTL